MLTRLTALCLTLLPTFALASALISPDMQAAANEITDAGIRAQIRFLSSDLLEGRGPSTRADQITQAYLSAALQTLGIKPGAPGGGWIQTVPLVGITTHTPDTLTLSAGTHKLTLKKHDEFIAVTGTQKSDVKIDNAELIFVGYGIQAPEFKWDDFKDVDVKGKILVVMNYNPPVFAGKKRLYYGRWSYKFEEAARRGAAGVIIIHTTPSAAYPWQVIQSSWSGERFELVDEGQPHVKMRAWTTEDASRKIVALSGHDLDKLRASAESRDFRPVPLDVKMSIDLTTTINKTQSGNVIGVIPGSDPTLASEAVIYSAHHDHEGMKRGVKGENIIYNGALDNASGVAAVLSIAKAFTHLPKPVKRSIYFVFTAAEEQGLLGAEYFVLHPPVPVGRMAADINFDGIGFYGRTRDLSLSGAGKSSLDKELAALAATQGRIILPESKPEQGGFYRSDQFNFAKAGVPVTYYFSGVDVIGKPKGWGQAQIDRYISHDYHQPSDIYKESFDFSGALEDLRLAFYLGVNVGNAAMMPSWNKGDEFEAARLKAVR